ncbi:hypothetical protein GCM10010954_25730 [Halobacillus andaensis]|uniref:CstA N-terminal domain-containing protein n=1 Tax=Halobacillus andaensis TaxID=1176239 RepID=A0A917EXB2_HALAA|nr:hypothetical protein GCM10010954_25730 [Halobacillus andaensis]
MLTFVASILFLLAGYFIYAKVVERIFGINDENQTPAYTHNDGFDYTPMSWWRASLIQLLNIAGLGPIFGAVMGALYGPVAFIWIVIGCIFAGAVHDYFSGMMSVRHKGAQYPTIVGKYLGKNVAKVINLLSIALMILCSGCIYGRSGRTYGSSDATKLYRSTYYHFCLFPGGDDAACS